MSEILHVELEPDPLVVIFGFSDNITFQKSQQQLLSYGLLIAKKLILKFWKNINVPTVKMWLDEMIRLLHLERIRFSLSNKLDQFDKIWSPLFRYLDSIV